MSSSQPDDRLPVAAVSAIVMDDSRRVLLVRRANRPAFGLYAFPGGRVDDGETPESAALRELREETGLIAAAPKAFRTYDLIERRADGAIDSHFALTVYRAHLAPHSPRIPIAADDAAEAAWFDEAATRDLPMPDSVRECLDIVFSQALAGGASN